MQTIVKIIVELLSESDVPARNVTEKLANFAETKQMKLKTDYGKTHCNL